MSVKPLSVKWGSTMVIEPMAHWWKVLDLQYYILGVCYNIPGTTTTQRSLGPAERDGGAYATHSAHLCVKQHTPIFRSLLHTGCVAQVPTGLRVWFAGRWSPKAHLQSLLIAIGGAKENKTVIFEIVALWVTLVTTGRWLCRVFEYISSILCHQRWYNFNVSKHHTTWFVCLYASKSAFLELLLRAESVFQFNLIEATNENNFSQRKGKSHLVKWAVAVFVWNRISAAHGLPLPGIHRARGSAHACMPGAVFTACGRGAVQQPHPPQRASASEPAAPAATLLCSCLFWSSGRRTSPRALWFCSTRVRACELKWWESSFFFPLWGKLFVCCSGCSLCPSKSYLGQHNIYS